MVADAQRSGRILKGTLGALGRTLTRLLDEEDRRAIGMLLVLAAEVLFVAVVLAAAAGLAIRVFSEVSGVG